MKNTINTTGVPPAGTAPLSHANIYRDLVFTSGQIHLNENMELVGETTTERTHQAMNNLQKILEAAGSSFAHVLKTTIYVTDMSIYGELNEVYSSYFEGDYPAREVVCVKELPLGASLEISMVALRK